MTGNWFKLLHLPSLEYIQKQPISFALLLTLTPAMVLVFFMVITRLVNAFAPLICTLLAVWLLWAAARWVYARWR